MLSLSGLTQFQFWPEHIEKTGFPDSSKQTAGKQVGNDSLVLPLQKHWKKKA